MVQSIESDFFSENASLLTPLLFFSFLTLVPPFCDALVSFLSFVERKRGFSGVFNAHTWTFFAIGTRDDLPGPFPLRTPPVLPLFLTIRNLPRLLDPVSQFIRSVGVDLSSG